MKSASRSQPSILTHSEHCSNSRHTPSSSFSGFKLLSDNSSKMHIMTNFRLKQCYSSGLDKNVFHLRRPKFQAQWHPCSKTDSREVLISDFFWPDASKDIATIVMTLSRIGENDVNFFGIKWPKINCKRPKMTTNRPKNYRQWTTGFKWKLFLTGGS